MTLASSVAPGAKTVPLTATAVLNGQAAVRTHSLPLSVLSAATTAFVGRILNTADEPLMNVRVTLLDARTGCPYRKFHPAAHSLRLR